MARRNVVKIVLEAIDKATPEIAKTAQELMRLESIQRGSKAPLLVDQWGRELKSTQRAAEELFDEYNKGAEEAAEKTKKVAKQVAAWDWEMWQVSAIATAAFAGMTLALAGTVKESQELELALKGLTSIAEGMGHDVDAAKQAAIELASDGLMTVKEAAQGLKNLLLAGYGLPQAIDLMMRFKDSAAFGRQGALEFGEAVVGATEGVKNFLPRLVDNAGVTKNLIDMYKDYAKQLGTTADKLTEQQKLQAIYNGVMEETRYMVGNAQLLVDSLSGAMSQLGVQIKLAKAALGDALTPAIITVVQAMQPLAEYTGDLIKAYPDLAAGISIATTAFVGLVAVLSTLGFLLPMIKGGLVKTAAAFGLVNIAAGPVILTIGAVAVAIGGLVYALRKQREEQERTARATKEAYAELNDIIKTYHEQHRQEIDRTIEAEEELMRVREQAAEQEKRRIIAEIDRLHNALTSALKKRYREEEEQHLKSIDRQIELLQSFHNAEIKAVEEQTNAKIAAYRKEIEEIDALLDAKRRQEWTEDRLARKAEIEYQLARTHDVEQARKYMLEIHEIETEIERAKEEEKLKARRDALEEKIEAERDTTRQVIEQKRQENQETIEHLRMMRERTREHYEQLRDEAEAHAEWMIRNFEQTQDEIVKLLSTYEEDFGNLGKSLGERLVEGFKSVDIKTAVRNAIDMAVNSSKYIDRAVQRAVSDWAKEKGITTPEPEPEQRRITHEQFVLTLKERDMLAVKMAQGQKRMFSELSIPDLALPPPIVNVQGPVSVFGIKDVQDFANELLYQAGMGLFSPIGTPTR